MNSSWGRNKGINILVGVEYFYSHISSEIKRGRGNHTLAITSIFGWILYGPKETEGNVYTNFNSSQVLNTENAINNCFDLLNSILVKSFTRKIEIKDDTYSSFK